MDARPHKLETLLQFLVTDSSCVAHLSHILIHLSSACLAPSSHLQKWVTRVTSLMHSKDPAARWAAICIAYRMSFLSGSLLTDNAQPWVGIVFPSLSRPEPTPVLRVAMQFLSLVLCAAGDNSEFQKQIAIPMVPKVSSALLTIAEKHNNLDVKTTSIRTLTQLVPLYPSLHKALSQRLFALCNQIFGDPEHRAMDGLLDATANLYAILHHIGGKVGGVNLWRSCLDETLHSSWSAWLSLRTTFPTSARLSHKAVGYLRSSGSKLPSIYSHADSMTGNPLTTVALNLDRLKSGIRVISGLLRAPVNRPVKIPIGHLVAFCWCLLSSSPDDDGEQTHFDPHTRVAEATIAPQIWTQACHLLSYLAQTMRDLLAPHISRLITMISFHLENNPERSQKRVFLQCAYQLLYYCPIVGAALGINRLLKVTISILSPLYLHQLHTELSSGAIGQPKAGKKRRREYEADNPLLVGNITVCSTTDDCDTLIAALDVVDQCMLNAELSPSTRSVANRVLLSILLSLPSTPSSSLSSDPNFHGRVVKKVREICVESAQGTSYAASKGTGFVLRSFSSENLVARDRLHSRVDVLLHPRRPPLVRTLPCVESLSLSCAEESTEEMTVRHSLGPAFIDGNTRSIAPEPQTRPETADQSPLQAPTNLPQVRRPLSSADLHQQSGNGPSDSPVKVVAASLPPPPELPLQPVPYVPIGSPSISQKEPVSMVHEAPMLVDESDHEEVPAIDLNSDSDT